MKQYLIRPDRKSYKANLHCHSICSDGRLTPEQLKAAYKEHGYSILSITDHEILLSHEELCDEDFLLLPGYEIGLDNGHGQPIVKACHMNLYPIEKDNLSQVLYNAKYLWGNGKDYVDQLQISPEGRDLVREHTAEGINQIIRIARDNGFLVAYNHPTWSLHDATDYLNYDGFFAVEVHNYACFNGPGLPEYNSRVYDDMLRAGKRLYVSAADDNHNRAPLDDPKSDSFGGYVMIQAESLTHENVMSALQNGDFYASTGPEIRNLYVEDGTIHIETSPVRHIQAVTADRHGGGHEVAARGAAIERAEFKLPEAYRQYFRFEVADWEGNRAYTRAYFLDELTGE